MDMEVVYEEGNVIKMVELLVRDLSNVSSLKAISRLPEPGGGKRYRDMLYSIFKSFGYVYASIRVEFRDGLIRNYVFLGRAIPREGRDDFMDMPVRTEGYIIEVLRDRRTYRYFNEFVFSNGREMFRKIKEVGDKFRISDMAIYMEWISTMIDLDLESDIGG